MSFLRQRVRRRDVIAVFAVTTLLWLLAVAAIVATVRERFDARIALRNVPVQLSLPPRLQARAEVLTPLTTHLDWTPTVPVPIDQNVHVTLPPQLGAHALVNAIAPIDTTIDFNGSIPVAIDLDMLLPVRSWLPRVHVKTPVKLVVPVRLRVPIHAQVPLALDTDVTALLPPDLIVPLHTTLRARVPIRGDAQAVAINQTDFVLHAPVDALRVAVRRADVQVPLQSIGWRRSTP